MTIFKVEHLDALGWEHALRGMRNAMDSHDRADSTFNPLVLGPNDMGLALKLLHAGPSHRKFLRQVMIYCDVTASLKWWDEFDTYLHVVKNSTSQMHKLGKRELTVEDFSFADDYDEQDLALVDNINARIRAYQASVEEAANRASVNVLAVQARVRRTWRKMIDNVPQSFLYRRTVAFNYEVFLTMYPNRKNHKMYEWRIFCDKLCKDLPLMMLFLDELKLYSYGEGL